MWRLGAKKFSIPGRSPELNPVENGSNYVETKLHEESLLKNKTFENFKEYSVRLKKTLISVSVGCINKTIESMANLLRMVVKKHGEQIKY